MKPSKDLLNQCYYNAMIMHYRNELIEKGFSVYLEHSFHGKQVDLFAQNDSEKRVYDFKLIGNSAHTTGVITKFKLFVESHGAKPYVIYVNPPEDKQIQFDDLDTLLTDYFLHEALSSKLDVLSTYARIDSVQVDDLTSVKITDCVITLDGHATIFVDMQDGLKSDIRQGSCDSYADRFPMSFCVKLGYDENYFIENIEYDIDTSGWYE